MHCGKDNDILSKLTIVWAEWQTCRSSRQHVTCRLSVWFHQSGADVFCVTLFSSYNVYWGKSLLTPAANVIITYMRWGEERQYLPWTVVILSSPSGRTTARDRSWLMGFSFWSMVRWGPPGYHWDRSEESSVFSPGGDGALLLTETLQTKRHRGSMSKDRVCMRGGSLSANVCPLSQTLVLFETQWGAGSINGFLYSSGFWKHGLKSTFEKS